MNGEALKFRYVIATPTASAHQEDAKKTRNHDSLNNLGGYWVLPASRVVILTALSTNIFVRSQPFAMRSVVGDSSSIYGQYGLDDDLTVINDKQGINEIAVTTGYLRRRLYRGTVYGLAASRLGSIKGQ